MRELVARYRAIVGFAMLAGVSALAGISFALSTVDLWRPLVMTLFVCVVIISWRFLRTQPPFPTAVVTAALIADVVRSTADWPWVVCGVTILLLVLLESEGRRQIRRRNGANVIAYNLPGFAIKQAVSNAIIFDIACGTVLLFALIVGFRLPLGFAVALSVLSVLTVLSIAAYEWVMWPAERRFTLIRDSLTAYEPRFLVYFSAPTGSTYQLSMWIPYLDRVGLRYAVLLRETHSVDEVRAMTTAPIVVAPSLAALDNAIVDSTEAVFYVNNGMKNTQAVRFSEMTHIQLLHGDSDKPPSYSPVTAMYDRILVAGQAGIDRYSQHDVLIHAQKFIIVGRPQVEAIAPAKGPVTAVANPVVLYAPTWQGFYTDTSFSSLPFGTTLVQSLLDLGATIIFRPHPYSLQDAASVKHVADIVRLLAASTKADGRSHVFGDEATKTRTLFECFNESDAMVTDVSSVAADYLFSRKPFAVSDVGLGAGDPSVEFPLIRAAYLWRHQETDPREMLATMLREDPMAELRLELRAYYLGDFPTEGYADVFISKARELVKGTNRPRPNRLGKTDEDE